LIAEIRRAERATAEGKGLNLRIAVDFSARDAAVRAAQQLALGPRALAPSSATFETALAAATHAEPGAPPIDLLVRTGGEFRLSDQLAWEAAYAELLFLEKMWPEFAAGDLAVAFSVFANRQRRFGALSKAG
jgi:undecaprenyl diphosphate synthase